MQIVKSSADFPVARNLAMYWVVMELDFTPNKDPNSVGYVVIMATSPKFVGPNNLAATTFVTMPIAAPTYDAPAMGMVWRAIGFLNTRFALDQPKAIAVRNIFAVDGSETMDLLSIPNAPLSHSPIGLAAPLSQSSQNFSLMLVDFQQRFFLDWSSVVATFNK